MALKVLLKNVFGFGNMALLGLKNIPKKSKILAQLVPEKNS